MICDVDHVHFCGTRLVKLQGLAVVSKILIYPKEERAWVDEGGVCVCCFLLLLPHPQMRIHSCFKAPLSALSVSIQLLS